MKSFHQYPTVGSLQWKKDNTLVEKMHVRLISCKVKQGLLNVASFELENQL